MTTSSIAGDRKRFVLGVFACWGLVVLLARSPATFGIVCSAAAVPTVVSKAISYYLLNWHLFALDFCYWVNLLPAIGFFLPVGRMSRIFYAVLFLHANGPVAIAVPVWNQSLVFHDFERILSVGLHTWPMLASYAAAWSPYNEAAEGFASSGWLAWDDFGWAIAFYLLWQIFYFATTNILLKSYIASDPTLQSSFRWIASDHKNSVNVLLTGLARRYGVFTIDEKMSPNSLKSESLFMGIQLVYTLVTLALSMVLKCNQYVHLTFVCVIMASSLWNGSSVYLEGSEDDMTAPEIDVSLEKDTLKKD